MSVHRYSLLNNFSGKVWNMIDDYGESNVDKSFYRPDIASTRAKLGGVQGSTLTPIFDFPDGKDTGDTIMTILRDKGLDITEIDTIGEIIKDHLSKGKQKDVADAEEKARTLEGKKFLDWAKSYIENNPLPQTQVSSPASNSPAN